jgi:hypothetical protein
MAWLALVIRQWSGSGVISSSDGHVHGEAGSNIEIGNPSTGFQNQWFSDFFISMELYW